MNSYLRGKRKIGNIFNYHIDRIFTNVYNLIHEVDSESNFGTGPKIK
ncbi:hypothetical protein EV207_11070 [Scopulibacillus darangshiensis]|uniref:Uncharacterized protein n=1 Tax=Scopulibacillus darangshiensis TaxID=442528 RepID=A0A4R2P3T0_9BACL|nr:hypothetical protein EV207_11070 [Scopulibacillus darangshiensis]